MVAVFGSFHVFRTHLRDLEGPEADIAAELDDQVVPVTSRRPSKLLEFLVCDSYCVHVFLLRGFQIGTALPNTHHEASSSHYWTFDITNDEPLENLVEDL